MIAYAYARYSSDNQRQESIDAQLQDIRAYAVREGLTIVKVFIDEAESAKSDDRPEFQHMVEDAKTGRPDFVLVHKLDRFARNRYDSAFYRKLLKDAGTKLVSVLEPLDDSPESVILMSVLEGMAEYYSLNLAREVKKGLKQNAQKGLWNGGTPPIGYMLNSEKRLVVDEAEAPIVRAIFSKFLEGYGYHSISQELNRMGMKTSRGGIWRRNSIYDVLTNEKYIGNYVYSRRSGKRADGKRNNRLMKPESEVIRLDGAIPAIIDQETWEKVSEKMKGRRTGPRPGASKRLYLLTGVLWCGVCGSPYVGAGYRKKPQYTYYACTKRGLGVCKNLTISQDMVERHVLSELMTNVFNSGAIECLVPLLLEELKKRGVGFERERDAVRLEIKDVLTKISRLVDSIESGTAGEDVKERIALRRVSLNELKTRESFLESQICSQADADMVRGFLLHHRDNLTSADPAKQRKTIETFVQRVVVFPDRFDCHFRIESPVSDRTGGDEAVWTLSLTVQRDPYGRQLTDTRQYHSRLDLRSTLEADKLRLCRDLPLAPVDQQRDDDPKAQGADDHENVKQRGQAPPALDLPVRI